MNMTECLSRQELLQYCLGKLDPASCDKVESHLEKCPPCEETLVALEDATDSLIRDLRKNSPEQAESQSESQYADDQHYRQALTQIQQMPPESQPETREDWSVERVFLRDYELLDILGRGGMGTVFRGLHTKLDMAVAIKVLPNRRMRDEEAVNRFQREMKVVGKLDHPAIVRATDAGEEEGVHFLAMELLDGFNLQQIVAHCGPLPVADACQIIQQAAEGLDHAHQKGIIHRDVKPSNLMLSDGQVKILDLGLALLSGIHSPIDELTTIGQLMGTLDYMAPEQCDNSHDVNPAADVYSLAATLFKLLTGQPPHGSQPLAPLAKLRQIASQPLPDIHSLAEHLPRELCEVIQKGLAKNPAERYPSAGEFAQELSRWTQGADLHRLNHTAQSTVAASDLFAIQTEQDEILANQVERRHKTSQPEKQLATSGTRPQPKPKTGSNWLTKIAAVFMGVALAALLGIVVYLETGKGLLVIKANEEVSVKIVKSDKVYKSLTLRPGENETRLYAGEYEIVFEGQNDQLEIKNGRFRMGRSGNWVAEVVELNSRQAGDTGGPSQTHQPLETSGPDRFVEENLPIYEGQTFGEWVQVLQTERSTRFRIRALDALMALATDQVKMAEVLEIAIDAANPNDWSNNAPGVASSHRTYGEVVVSIYVRCRSGEPVHRLLEEKLRSGNSAQRFAVLSLILTYGVLGKDLQIPIYSSLVDAVIVASNDDNKYVKDQAIRYFELIKRDQQEIIDCLLGMTEDPEKQVRESAILAVALLRPQHDELSTQLVKMARSGDIHFQFNVITEFRKPELQDSQSLAYLKEVVSDERSRPRSNFVGVTEIPPGLQGVVRSLSDYAIMTLREFTSKKKEALEIVKLYEQQANEVQMLLVGHVRAILNGTDLSVATETLEQAYYNYEQDRLTRSYNKAKNKGPVFEGEGLDYWVGPYRNHAEFDIHLVRRAIASLRKDVSPKQVSRLIDLSIDNLVEERSAEQLIKEVHILCGLAVDVKEEDAINAILETIEKRTELYDPNPIYNYEFILLEAACTGLRMFDESLVIQKLDSIIETGTSNQRLLGLACRLLMADEQQIVISNSLVFENLAEAANSTNVFGQQHQRMLEAAAQDPQPLVVIPVLISLSHIEGIDEEKLNLQIEEFLAKQKFAYQKMFCYRCKLELPFMDKIVDEWSAHKSKLQQQAAVTLLASRIGLSDSIDEKIIKKTTSLLSDAEWGTEDVRDNPLGSPRFQLFRMTKQLGHKAKPLLPLFRQEFEAEGPLNMWITDTYNDIRREIIRFEQLEAEKQNKNNSNKN